MQFVTGGACNGKAKWVRENSGKEVQWIRLFDTASMPYPDSSQSAVVFEGLEYLVLAEIDNHQDSDEIRKSFLSLFTLWQKWEEELPSRQVIWIGSDIGKGIVPVDPLQRKWRDLTGWVYQDLVNKSSSVHEIWFGIPQLLKAE